MLVDLVDKKLQREIFVPWLRFFPLKVIIPDTGLTRQYQSIRLAPRFSGGRVSADNASCAHCIRCWPVPLLP